MALRDDPGLDRRGPSGWQPDPAPETGAGSGKLAIRVARRIEEEILRRGWPVGESLGREKDLEDRFGVSRAVMREALAMTEQDGLTLRQRGRYGGLAIAAPTEFAATSSIANYLNLSGVTRAETASVWHLLDRAATRLATARCTEADALAFRVLARAPMPEDPALAWERCAALRSAIFGMTGNRVIGIVGQVLHCLALVRLHGGPLGSEPEASLALARRAAMLGARLGEAIVGDQPAQAAALQHELAALWLQSFDRPPGAPPPVATLARAEQAMRGLAVLQSPARAPRRSETLAYQLANWITSRRGEGAAARLETESALMAQFDVGRGVLREAIRYLERYAVVRMTPGRSGGLRIGEADPKNAVRSAVLLLRALAVQASQVDDLLREIELAVASTVAGRVAAGVGDAVEPLAAALDLWPSAVDDIDRHLERVYGSLNAMAGNTLLDLLMRIFAAYVRTDHRRGGPEMVARYDDYVRHLRAAAAALARGDEALGRRAMLAARASIAFLRPEVRDLADMLDRLG